MQMAKERVLLVDDEPQILLALEDLLSEQYTVLKSETPERALDLMRTDREIAVVITDQRMPLMNAIEFLSGLATAVVPYESWSLDSPDLPAVLRAVTKERVSAYVTKPWDEKDLLRKVQAAAAHFRMGSGARVRARLAARSDEQQPRRHLLQGCRFAILRANAAFARSIDGKAAGGSRGTSLSEVLSVDSEAAAVRWKTGGSWRSKRPILDSVRKRRRDGKHQFLSETKAPIRSAAGPAIGLLGISRDATERVKMSQELREAEAALEQHRRILHSILDARGDGAVVIAKEGRTLLCNTEADRLLGLKERHVPAEAWPETYGLYLGDSKTPLPADQNPLCRALRGEPLVRVELTINNRAVSGALVTFTVTPLTDVTGAIIGATALLRDARQ